MSVPIVCRVLYKHGLTQNKIKQVALQKSECLRGTFVAEMSFFSLHQLVWVDETGCDARNHIHKTGYAFRGQTPTCT